MPLWYMEGKHSTNTNVMPISVILSLNNVCACFIRGGIGRVGERLKKSYKETVYKKYILFENIGILPYISFWLHSQVPKMIFKMPLMVTKDM